MSRELPRLAAALTVLLLAAVGLIPAPWAESRQSEILVRLAPEGVRAIEPGPGHDGVPAFLKAFGVLRLRPLVRSWPGKTPPLLSQLGLDRLYVVEVHPTQNVRALSRQLSTDSRIESAEPADGGEGGADQALALDSYFFDQWRLRNIGQLGGVVDADLDVVEAWTTTIGHRDTLVAVLDSGIDGDHTEFRGRIAQGGYDYWNADFDPEDDHSHGTRVAGQIAANANNRFGVTGINWRASVLPIKILDAGNRGNSAVLIEGLLHAAAAGADIANMSLIHYPDSQNTRDAITFAHAAGVILIGCNGNDGTLEINYPAAYPEVLSTGWSTDDDLRDGSSNFTPTLDLVAPGRSVRTASWNNSTDQRDFFSGCSAATPNVTASASLLLALDPTLTFEQVRDILRNTADDEVGNPAEDIPGRDDYYGWGRVNTDAAVRALGLADESRMHVDQIEIVRLNTSRLEVRVIVVDQLMGVESGALVTGRLDTPTLSDIVLSGTTGSNGEAVMLHDNVSTLPAGPYRFEVTDVELADFTYDSAANHVTVQTRRPGYDGVHVRRVEFVRGLAGLTLSVQVVDDDEIPEGDVSVEGILTRPSGPTEGLQFSTHWAAGGVATFVVNSGSSPEPGTYGFEVTNLSKSGFEYESDLDTDTLAALLVVAPTADPDGDNIADEDDNCPSIANPDQADSDLDGFGDLCDVCPEQVDFAQRDSDLDGTGNRCDCARYDATRTELDLVRGLVIDSDGRTLRWFGVVGADRYDVLRGSLSLLDGDDFGACIGDDQSGFQFEDAAVPAPGSGFFYLVRADDAVCGAGPLGIGRARSMRVNTNPSDCS